MFQSVRAMYDFCTPETNFVCSTCKEGWLTSREFHTFERGLFSQTDSEMDPDIIRNSLEKHKHSSTEIKIILKLKIANKINFFCCE